MNETANKTPVCDLCGEPLPPGEEMFKLHGYSGPCPKPPLAPQSDTEPMAPPPVESLRTDTSLSAVATDDLIAELMNRFPHAVFSALREDGRERFQFRGNWVILQGLGTSIASRVADARRREESPEQ